LFNYNVPGGGAGLTVVTLQGIPDQFQLEIKGEDARRACKVAWKKGSNRLGVDDQRYGNREIFISLDALIRPFMTRTLEAN
jgi:hypothetical protein